jgi:hypothetical protein
MSAYWKAPKPELEPTNPYLDKLQGIALNVDAPEVVPSNWTQTYEPSSVYGTPQSKNSDGFATKKPANEGT